MSTKELLERLRNKGACHHTINNADFLLRQLKEKITGDEWFEIYIAISHFRLGEGSAEFYSVMNLIKQRYETVC